MDYLDDYESKIKMAIIAHEVGLEAIENIIDYYNQMLLNAIIHLARATEVSPMDLHLKLEKELNLVGAMDSYLNSLKATTNLGKEVFGVDYEDDIDDLD
jgi:hypothetical protein